MVMIVLGMLITWCVVLEKRAKSKANEFCDSIDIGSPYVETAARAGSIGENRLRIIGDKSIVVGFTGIPPFSRHLCEVSRDGDRVGGKRYIYLD